MSKNSYRKALRHIKSKKIDERLELLSEIPTNATSGVYVDTPGQFVQDPDVDNPQFSDHPPDLTQDDSATDTTGLFLSDGTILTAIPPGDNSYVLGPMMSMNYSWGNFTQIGYVRQSDRKMVNLARITGTIEAWDGESGFTSYGQLTLAQAQWFKDQSKSDFYAFYPGPPSDGSDGSGRYKGSCVNSRRTYGTRTPDPRYVDSGSNRSGDPSDNYSAQSDKDKSVDPKSYPTDPEERAQMSASELAELGINLLNIGLDIAAIAAIIFPEPGTSAVGLARIATRLGLRAGSTALKASRAARTTQALNQGVRAARVNPAQRVRNSAKNSKLKDWWNKGRNERVPDENNASWRDLMRDDLAQRGQSDASFAAGKPPRGIGRPDQAFNPFRPASKGGPGSGPTPAVRQAFERPVRSIGRAVRRLKKEDGPKKFSDFHNELLLMEENLLLEQEAAAETAAPSNGIQANSGNITPEQEQKVNATADEFADEVAKELSDEEAAEAAVDAESDVAQQEAEATFLSEDPVEAFNQIIDLIGEYDLTLDDITSDDMDMLFSIGDQLAILNGTDPGTQAKFLEILGVSPTMLSNFTDNSYREFDNLSKNGWRWWYLKPGGTPSTGWDGKFYMYDDPLLEVSRIVSLEQYEAARKRSDWYGLETPALAGPGRRYKVVPPRYKGGKETYELVTVTQFNANAVDRASRILGTGQLGGRGGLGLSWEWSMYHGKVDPILTGFAGAAEDAVRLATKYLRHVIKTNLVSDIVADRISNLQRYPGIYGKEGNPNQLTDDTWNVYDFTWGNAARDMDWVFSLNSNDMLSTGPYGDRLWREWESVKEFGLSLKELDWKKYDNDKWYGDGEFSKSHPLIGMTPPEPTPEAPKEYPPELNEIGGDQYLEKKTITKDGFKKSDGDFDIFAAGGGNAKMAQGFTYEQVMEIGRKNLNVAKLKNIDNKGDMQIKVEGGDVQLLNYQSNLGFSADSDGSYNTGGDYALMLAPELGISILTGQSREMKVSGRAKQEMIDSIDIFELQKALQIGPAVKPTVDNAVRPTPGKKLNVLTGVYGVPGAVEVNYDPKSDTFTITSNKMLRVGEKGDEFGGGRQTRFGDIPNPSVDSIAELAGQIVTTMFASVGVKPPGGISSEVQAQLLKQQYTDTQWINAMLGAAAQVMDFTIQGTTSNIVAIRKLMTDTGIIKKSAMEKTGGGYGHVYSQTSYTGSEIPQSLRQLINSKIQAPGELTSTDAAVAAAERARREEEERRRRERRRGQGGRSLGDTTERGGMQESKEVLTKSHKRILREIKKPYELPETPTKFKVSPKVIGSKNKIVGADMMREQEIQKSFKAKPDNIWGKEEYAANVRASQEKKNTVLELVGAAEHHWTTLTEKSQREKQEKINEMMAAEHDKEMKIMYEKYQKNQNKVDKIRSHYQGKPSPEGYPIKPPPETVDGYHPRYGKNYKYDKLDPHSAESMPKTGDQEIDANIDKATDHEKKDRKLKNLMGKVRKG